MSFPPKLLLFYPHRTQKTFRPCAKTHGTARLHSLTAAPPAHGPEGSASALPPMLKPQACSCDLSNVRYRVRPSRAFTRRLRKWKDSLLTAPVRTTPPALCRSSCGPQLSSLANSFRLLYPDYPQNATVYMRIRPIRAQSASTPLYSLAIFVLCLSRVRPPRSTPASWCARLMPRYASASTIRGCRARTISLLGVHHPASRSSHQLPAVRPYAASRVIADALVPL